MRSRTLTRHVALMVLTSLIVGGSAALKDPMTGLTLVALMLSLVGVVYFFSGGKR